MVALRLLAVLLLLLPAACQQPAADGQEIRVGLAQSPMSLDPRQATDAASHRIQQFIHRGLVKLDDKFRPQPDLAEAWRHPDPLTWEFTLRPGLRFHNGMPLTAADVVATLQSILDPEQGSPHRAGFLSVAALEAPAADLVRIRLSRPDASLLTRLAIGILPASLAAGPHSPRQTVGAGPYRLAHWRGNVLDIEPVAPGHPSIRFITIKDPVTRCLKLARGEIDFLQNDLPPHLIPYLRRQPGVRIEHRPSTTFSYIGLNLQDPILKSPKVRRALALAIDRDKLKKTLFADLPVPAETILTPDHWAAASLPPTPYDPDEAQRLLDAAGYPRQGSRPRFTINYRTSTDPDRLRLVTAIADYWRRIGVDVAIESLEWGGFYARIKRGDFQAFSLDWVGITDPDIYRWVLYSSMWPPKGSNRGRFSDPEVDGWLDEAAASEDMEEQRQLYARIERRMHDEEVYLPLWYRPVIAVLGPRIHGYRLAADGSLLGLADVHPDEATASR